MARSRSRSRTRANTRSKKVRYQKSGLPYLSDMKKADVGITIRDKKGALKTLHHVRGKYSWKTAEVKDLSKKRSDYFYNQLNKNLNNSNKVRDILEKALKEVQPKESKKY